MFYHFNMRTKKLLFLLLILLLLLLLLLPPPPLPPPSYLLRCSYYFILVFSHFWCIGHMQWFPYFAKELPSSMVTDTNQKMDTANRFQSRLRLFAFPEHCRSNQKHEFTSPCALSCHQVFFEKISLLVNHYS